MQAVPRLVKPDLLWEELRVIQVSLSPWGKRSELYHCMNRN